MGSEGHDCGALEGENGHQRMVEGAVLVTLRVEGEQGGGLEDCQLAYRRLKNM